MPKLDQNLILPGEMHQPEFAKIDFKEWRNLFQPDNPTGIAGVLGLGNAFLQKNVTAYTMGYDGKLTPIDPLDDTLPPSEDREEDEIITVFDRLESKMGEAYTAACNNRLFVPNEDGKLVQVCLSESLTNYECSLSAPFDSVEAFTPPPKPSIWKRIFFFLFSDEIREYNFMKKQYDKFSDAEVVNSYIQAASDSALKLNPENPDDPKAAPQKKDPLTSIRAYLNKIAYDKYDWALAVLQDPDCTTEEYCAGMARNLEARAAREVLKKAENDPENANKIIADAKKPFATLRKDLEAFVRKDINMKKVSKIVNEDGAESMGYENFLGYHYEYLLTALDRYHETLTRQSLTNNDLSPRISHGEKNMQPDEKVIAGDLQPQGPLP